MKKFKNNLDEMQELNLLKIEKTGFWIMYIGLAVVIVIQMLIYREEALAYMAGETVVLVAGCIYTVAACIRKGIWSRRLTATPITNLVQSIIWSAIFSVVIAIIKYVQYGSLPGAIASGVVFFIFIVIICYVVLTVLMISYKKRKRELEKEDEE